MNRVYVSDLKANGSVAQSYSTKKVATNKLRGAYIVKIAGELVFTVNEAKEILRRIKRNKEKELLHRRSVKVKRKMLIQEREK